MTTESTEECHDILFTEQDVVVSLSRLREDKAAGADELSPHFLLQINHNISYPLYLLFRKSLDMGIVPDDWKCANISPVFKKGSRNKVENYRPVSDPTIEEWSSCRCRRHNCRTSERCRKASQRSFA